MSERCTSVATLICFGMLGAITLISGCQNGPRLFVEARSDLRAGVEFDQYEVQVISESGLARSIGEATVDDDAFEGIRVGEFGGVGAGRVEVVVRLMDGERVVISRTMSASVSGDRAVVVPLYRACVDVACPPSTDPSLTTCVRGACVSPECSEDHPEACPEAECEADSDCSVMNSGCLTGRCLSGGCTAVTTDDLCPSGEYCHPTVGCVQALNCTDDCVAPVLSEVEQMMVGDASGDREGNAVGAGDVFALSARPNGTAMDVSIFRDGAYRRFLDGESLTGSECGSSAAVGNSHMLIGCPGAGGILVQSFLGSSLIGTGTLVSPFGSRIGTVVSASGDDYAASAPSTGEVRLFRGNGGSLYNEGGLSGVEGFGAAIAYHSGRILVGSPIEGAVHFARPADRLSPVDQFGSAGGPAGFGSSLATNDDLVAVGAPDGPSARVELFRYDGADYVPVQTISAPSSDARFGAALSMSGELLAVGAPDYESTGAVFVYQCSATCVPLHSVIPAGRGPGAEVGASIAMQGRALWIGAPGSGEFGEFLRATIP